MTIDTFSEVTDIEHHASPKRSLRVLVVFLMSAIFFTLGGFYYFGTPPATFPSDSKIAIRHGMSVVDIVETFEQKDYVRSSSLLLLHLRFFYDTEDIRAGTYNFTEPIPTREVARIIAEVGPTDPLISLTFPEGSTVAQFAAIADDLLPAFDLSAFLSYATDYEGYLFPETYFVPETFTDEQLFELLRETSEMKRAALAESIEKHPLSFEEIIILASIIEREANTPESMKLVSGVLQNRLNIGMPLQADATMEYELGTPLNELPPGQLAIEIRKTDSPYNTYKYRGLPPTPIGNPGVAAITAVLEPTPSDYFYYITGTDGEFYFAETLSEHNQNIAQYLR